MSKVLKITLGIIAVVVLIIFIALDSFVKPAVEYGFHRAGFPKATVQSAEFSLSGTTLKNLKLDDSGTTVGEAKLFATVSDALAGHLTKIEVSDVKLALPLPPALAGKGPRGFNLFTNQIEVANALLTVQTPLGALPVKMSGTIVEKSKDYQASFSLDGEGEGGFAKLKADLTANFAKGRSAAKLDFRNIEAKLSHDPDFDMKRITGFVTATLDPDKAFPVVDAQLDLGMLRVYGVPLQGVQFVASAGTDKSEFIAKGQVQGDSGDFMVDLKADHKDPAADKMTLYGEAKLYKLDSLNIENMKGQGSVILQLTGSRTREHALSDMSAWKDLQGSAGLSLEKLSLPHLLSDAEALATMKLSFDPAKQVLTAQATDGNISFSGVYKKLDQLPLYLNIPFNGGKPAALAWDATAKTLQADFDGASFTGLNVQARQVNAHLNVSASAAPVFKGNIDVGELAPMAMRGWEYFIPVKVTAVLQPQPAAGSSVTDLIGGVSEKQERLAARLDGRYDSATGHAGLAVNMPPTLLRQSVTPLASLFLFSQHYIENGYGMLGLSGSVEWSGGAGNWTTRSSGELYLKDFTATVRGTVLSDVNTVMKLDSLFPLTLRGQSVAVGALNLGLPLTNGAAVVSLDAQGNLAVQQAAWTLAGGKVTSDPFSLSLKDMTSGTNLQLRATGLDLGELFKIAPMEGMEATGKVNGILPLQVRNGDITLMDTTLGTTGPGTLRYSPKSIPSFLENASAQQFIDLKTALLQFAYDRLEMKMSGPLSQSVKVNLHVQGKNPLFYSGRPVDFSLNLEGPLEHLGLAPGNGLIPDLIRTQMQDYEKAHGKL